MGLTLVTAFTSSLATDEIRLNSFSTAFWNSSIYSIRHRKTSSEFTSYDVNTSVWTRVCGQRIHERYTLKTYHFSLIGLGFFCTLLNSFQLYQFTGSSEEHLLLQVEIDSYYQSWVRFHYISYKPAFNIKYICRSLNTPDWINVLRLMFKYWNEFSKQIVPALKFDWLRLGDQIYSLDSSSTKTFHWITPLVCIFQTV